MLISSWTNLFSFLPFFVIFVILHLVITSFFPLNICHFKGACLLTLGFFVRFRFLNNLHLNFITILYWMSYTVRGCYYTDCGPTWYCLPLYISDQGVWSFVLLVGRFFFFLIYTTTYYYVSIRNLLLIPS